MVKDPLAAPISASPINARRTWRRYLRETRRPLHCLVFLLPWVIAYEAWVLRATAASGPGRDLVAHSLIQQLLSWFGLVGAWVPGVALVVILLIWQRARQDRWRVRWWVLGMMLAESLLLCVPLLVLAAFFPMTRVPYTAGITARIMVALGGGVYEELVFRLLLISALLWVFAEGAQFRGPPALATAIILAALAFAWSHFQPIGGQELEWKVFTFKLAAGVYLSAVFAGRGLGVAAGAHAAYNVLLVVLRGAA